MTLLAGISLFLLTIVIVATYGLIIVAVARNGRLPVSDVESVIVSGAARRELTWTVLPAIILLGFLLVSARAAGFIGVP